MKGSHPRIAQSTSADGRKGSADSSAWRLARPPLAPQTCTSIADAARSALVGAAAPLQMAETTLQRMAAGGMYDHVGGGFHRYSVDEHWHVPTLRRFPPRCACSRVLPSS